MPDGVPTFAKFGEKKREKYLSLLREGNHRMTAARGVAVSYELIRLYRHAHPEFAALEDLAEEEAYGVVEDALFRSAVGGNVTACQVWLYNRCSARWKDQRNVRMTGLEDVLRSLPPEFGAEVRRVLEEPVPRGSGAPPGPGTNGHAGESAG